MDDRYVARDPWRGVHDAIRDSIISGEYEPGSRLVEQQLADRFNTSRGPVRTALQQLERSGLVVSIDRRGTFVRSVSDADVEEIFSLHELLSRFAMRRAMERMGPEERKSLEEFKARPIPTDPAEFFDYLIGFGNMLFRMAHHSRLLEIYDTMLIQAQARSLFEIGTEMSGRPLHEQFDCRSLCDAMLRGDTEEALALSDATLDAIKRLWVDRLEARTTADVLEVAKSGAAG